MKEELERLLRQYSKLHQDLLEATETLDKIYVMLKSEACTDKTTAFQMLLIELDEINRRRRHVAAIVLEIKKALKE